MAAPIITFVLAVAVAGLAFWTTTVEVSESDAPAPIEDVTDMDEAEAE